MPRKIPDSSAGTAGHGERALIAAIQKRAITGMRGGGLVRIGMGDDCAVLRARPGHEIVVTTDLFLESVHFRRDWHTPESAGHRCLARGLSDLAAMGAEPLAAFLSMAVPVELAVPSAALESGLRGARKTSRSGTSAQTWISRFLDGLFALADAARIPLAGGDTAQAPPFPAPGSRRKPLPGAGSSFFVADIVLLGRVPAGEPLLRSGARAGDGIYVTGSLGGAAAELELLRRNQRKRLRALRAPVPGTHHPHLYPEPRLAVGRRLRGLASAAIDLSDGIATDLNHLCEASRLCAVLDADSLPIHPLAQAGSSAPDLAPDLALDMALGVALRGGEDYELLFTVPAYERVPRSIGGTPIHRIGTMRKLKRAENPSVLLRTKEGETLVSGMGWEHFQSIPSR
jgi:thiamine-monophosphate kinase